MKKLLIKIIFAACIAFSLNTAAGFAQTPAEPFDFKGVKLGISIDEFRKMPHPDADDADAHYAAKNSVVVCTGEKVFISKDYSKEPAEVAISDKTQKAAGVKKCVWVNKSNDSLANGKTAALSMANSRYAAYDYSFSFIPDPKDGVLRFYKFVGETNRDAFSAIISALTQKFGKPALSQDEVQNGLGNKFARTLASWRNENSEILVMDRFQKLNDMVIMISDIRLSDVYSKAEAEQKASKKNPI